MAHHKRKRSKKQRAGCLMCKPHKMNGGKGLDPRRQDLQVKAHNREIRRFGYRVR